MSAKFCLRWYNYERLLIPIIQYILIFQTDLKKKTAYLEGFQEKFVSVGRRFPCAVGVHHLSGFGHQS